jgi:hypothetical protein
MPIPKSMATNSSSCEPAANYTPLGARVEWVADLCCAADCVPIPIHQTVVKLSRRGHRSPVSGRGVRTTLCAAEEAPLVAKPVSMMLRLVPSRSRWLPVVALLAPAFAFLAAFT